MIASSTIVWFRRDLRLGDNPALAAAIARGAAVIPVYIHAPDEEAPWQPGAASNWWLHRSLEKLDESLRKAGSRLIVRRGPTRNALRDLAREANAKAIHWNRLVEPSIVARDKKLEDELWNDGVEVGAHGAGLLFEPGSVVSGTGESYQVFTPFWKRCLQAPAPAAPSPVPEKIAAPESWPASFSIEALGLLPRIAWDGGLRETWNPGEQGARDSLRRFLKVVDGYPVDRDVPSIVGTSHLSPHLHFGEISPRQIWHTFQTVKISSAAREKYLAEIGWREFAHHLLHHFPKTTAEPLRAEFARFPWRRSRKDLRAWQRGETGYPIVDAGMRELWATGWMHNRVRMITASFLVKHLLLPWQEGAHWFWDTLVDADLASNTLGWQWAAGCGADAAPYFRIFNPVLQGKKFDPRGAYVRRWVPELARMPDKFLHQPWEAPPLVRAQAGVRLGENYPEPVVDHREARARALAAFESIRKSK